MKLKFQVNTLRSEICPLPFFFLRHFLQDKDTNQAFIRIQKFAPKFENCRSTGSCWKRITLYGNDNSKTSFVVQLPCHRQYRREDRVIQVLRNFNG